MEERVNILLVDDQPAKLLSYEEVLKELGHNLFKASSASEALAVLLKHEIAVLLIDVVMPELDGFELAKMIRSHPRFERTAVIFVSAFALTELDRLKGYEYGAVDYIPVPVVPDLLRAKVRIFAELYRKTKELEELNAQLERRVMERTAQLEQANAELERRVEERTREREAALAQVHEMQKLESLGQLTGGVAHDFNNLLMAILGNLNLLAKRYAEVPGTERLLSGAIQAAERGSVLTKRMLAFARRQELATEAVDVRHLIDGMVDMLQRSLGPAVQITIRFQAGLPPVRTDRNQLELALVNLALNSRDAMPEGGELIIVARREAMTAGAQDLGPGDYICLSVADTGTGMDGDTLRRATEPFFTTKQTGQGTGLGLSIVHGLARQSGGALRITSEVGAGTVAELWLPAAACVMPETSAAGFAPPLPSAAAAAPGSPAPGIRRLRVLVVDDDPLVAEAMVSMVEDLGHEAIPAASGALALEVVRSDSTLDFVLTDYAMPQMNGAELAKQIRQLRPALPVLIATGYADALRGTELAFPRISKPYSQEELERRIAALLVEASGGNVVRIGAARER